MYESDIETLLDTIEKQLQSLSKRVEALEELDYSLYELEEENEQLREKCNQLTRVAGILSARLSHFTKEKPRKEFESALLWVLSLGDKNNDKSIYFIR